MRLYSYAAKERAAEARALVGRAAEPRRARTAASAIAFDAFFDEFFTRGLRQIAIACTVTAYSDVSLSDQQRFDARALADRAIV